MKIQWANDAKSYVLVEVMGAAYQIPADDTHPDWQNIKAMVDAGTLTIPDYEPPVPSDQQG